MVVREAQLGEPDHVRTVRREHWPASKWICSFRQFSGVFCSSALVLEASPSSDDNDLEPKFDGPPHVKGAKTVAFFGLTPHVEGAVKAMFSMEMKEMAFKLSGVPDNLDEEVTKIIPAPGMPDVEASTKVVIELCVTLPLLSLRGRFHHALGLLFSIWPRKSTSARRVL